eukprot:2832247-Prymnesium_polylepis.1
MAGLLEARRVRAPAVSVNEPFNLPAIQAANMRNGRFTGSFIPPDEETVEARREKAEEHRRLLKEGRARQVAERAARKEGAQRRREERKQRAATNVQRRVRGVFARKDVAARRREVEHERELQQQGEAAVVIQRKARERRAGRAQVRSLERAAYVHAQVNERERHCAARALQVRNPPPLSSHAPAVSVAPPLWATMACQHPWGGTLTGIARPAGLAYRGASGSSRRRTKRSERSFAQTR